MEGPAILSLAPPNSQKSSQSSPLPQLHSKSNQVGTVSLYGIHIVSLMIEGQERLCLAQISNTLLKQFSYNEIHNRRVALGITCVQCTPVQLETLRRAGAMPPSSRRCGMITRREAERLCKSFLSDNSPPRLPDDFAFSVHHECTYGCRGAFVPSRYNSSRAKCIKCAYCNLFFSPNKFIFHSHETNPNNKYVQPNAANFNSWRRHMKLSGNPPDHIIHAWEDVKAMFNGGTRKRLLSNQGSRESIVPAKRARSSPTVLTPPAITTSVPTPPAHPVLPRVPPFPELPLPLSRSLVMDYMWHQQATAAVAASKTPGFPFPSSALPWLYKRAPVLFPGHLPATLSGTGTIEPIMPSVTASPLHQSAFRPVIRPSPIVEPIQRQDSTSEVTADKTDDSDDEVDIETTEDDDHSATSPHNLRTTTSASNNNNSQKSSSPQCWSPPRETEREAEKISEESATINDVKPTVPSPKALDNWNANTFYRNINVMKNAETRELTIPDCSACRPKTIFYDLVNNNPTSTN
ncbi:SKI family transcriptional corepressor 2 [Microplitis mediator]|uniref:SKI family transcriptional corepressor 2 n=1 Tax=Microplitis mediator TaxID=375433 RepID=UPI002553A136|nr:SKI family transcriptional corepressor 2 [Microplitis mediator]XP_057321587.1 SKI family transcriptional corepressor 2 [Microplitis mediator]